MSNTIKQKKSTTRQQKSTTTRQQKSTTRQQKSTTRQKKSTTTRQKKSTTRQKKSTTRQQKNVKSNNIKYKKVMKGGRLPLESNVSPEGDGTQLGNDIINLVFSSINAITDTITTVVDVVDLSSNMGSEFSSPFSPGA